MTRTQRPKRSATPTAATFPPPVALPVPADAPPPRKPLYLCSPFVEAALVKGNFKTIVMLPKYVDIMEWVAVNSAPISRPIDLLMYLIFGKSSISTQISTSSMVSWRNVAHRRSAPQCRLAQRTFHSQYVMSLHGSRFFM